MENVEDEEVKEVYAHYGLAMYLAQCVEKGLALVLACRDGSQNIHRYAFDERLDEKLGVTYGTLARRYTEIAPSQEKNLADRLLESVEPRNWLAHRYFGDRAVEFDLHAGRRKMIGEFQRLIDTFEELDDEVTRLTQKLMEEKGLSEEHANKLLIENPKRILTMAEPE